MRNSKYFFGIIFLVGVLFFSTGSVQAVCVRSVNVNGAVGNCCDNNLNQQECDAVTYGTHTWADTCPQFVPSCGFPYPTLTDPSRVSIASDTSVSGCCIIDQRKTTADASNCQKNATSCTGANSFFLRDDPKCEKGIAISYCGGAGSNPDELGCCIMNTKDSSKYGPSNCVGDKKRSECSGQFDLVDRSCATHLSSSVFCKTVSVSRTASSNAAANTAATGTTVTTTFVNPIRFSTVSEVVGALLSNLKGIIATVAILFIVIGGVMYILSGGNEKTITTAKNTITSALIGLAIALAAPTFLKEIQNILGGGSGANPDELVNNALTLNQIAMRTLNLLLSITGILAIIGLVIGGSYYFTAYGDEKRAETGKGIITSAIIGIVIVMAALIIVRQIASLLGVS